MITHTQAALETPDLSGLSAPKFMKHDKIQKIALYTLGTIAVLSWCLVGYEESQKGLWKAEVRRVNERYAYWEARNDFSQGMKCFFRMSYEKNEKPRFSGEKDGPFEIWIPQYFPTFSEEAYRFSTEQFVAAYNSYMRAFDVEQRKRLRESKATPNDETPKQ